MNYIIFLFGVLFAVVRLVLIIKTDAVFRLFAKHENSTMLHVVAIVVRLVLGIVLIIGAPDSRFPITLQVLGWLSIISALILIAIGGGRFRRLIYWALKLAPSIKNIAGVLALLLGGFMIYAVA
jgi:hypothetical protein